MNRGKGYVLLAAVLQIKHALKSVLIQSEYYRANFKLYLNPKERKKQEKGYI
ncbi:MAG: hypothetical protein ACFFB5_24085 [Promethearchaeota archaeon]